MNPKTVTHSPLTPRLMLQLAAPHTWPASVLPVLFSAVLVIHQTQSVDPRLLFILLAVTVLMQSAVNTLNDYFDFVKGADTCENQVDPTDAVLVFNRIRPISVLVFFAFLMLTAFALGCFVILHAGWIPLAIGGIGAAVIYLYSGGKLPISYLPLGELTSGFVMGGLIPLACVQVLTLRFSWEPLLLAVPLIFGIALIMFTNNTCDIEKDRDAHRHTMSALLGRPAARTVYRLTVLLWIGSIFALTFLYFSAGWIILPFLLLSAWPILRALFANPLVLDTRIAAMSQILTLNILLNSFYSMAILCDLCLRT